MSGRFKPERELAADHAAGFAVATAGDHFDATHPVGMRGAEKRYQRVEGALDGVTDRRTTSLVFRHNLWQDLTHEPS